MDISWKSSVPPTFVLETSARRAGNIYIFICQNRLCIYIYMYIYIAVYVLMASGATVHHSMLCQLRLITFFQSLLFLMWLNLSYLSSRYLFLGSRLVCFAAAGARTKRGRTEYLVPKPLKLQNSWRIFDRPVSYIYCKYAEYVRTRGGVSSCGLRTWMVHVQNLNGNVQNLKGFFRTRYRQ